MTQKEIAKKAGVSVATISRVINDEEGVSKETRMRVLSLLDKYAYVRDNNARSLRTSHSKTIGYLTSNFSNPFFNQMYQGMEPICRKHGYNIIIGHTNESVRREKEAIDLMLSYRVAGIIASFVAPQESTLRKLKNYGTSLLALDRPQKNIDVDTVTMDNYNGARQQVNHLADLGHKRIALVYGIPAHIPDEDRLKGFYAAMEEKGLDINPDYLMSGKLNEEDAYFATTSILSVSPRPTAMVTHNNLMCIGAFKAIKDRGLSIPQDISLVGYDDFDFADYLEPSLTLVERPLKKMGEIAGKMIIERIEKKFTGGARTYVFPARLRINNSCTPPANSN